MTATPRYYPAEDLPKGKAVVARKVNVSTTFSDERLELGKQRWCATIVRLLGDGFMIPTDHDIGTR
jgi:hypothetical protein